ncbi:response regulator [Caenimonas sedimenti]|uniref:Response regulator n=1 Tax=Caenimonas sedimenti TaxID=2596921 RepID=A0A562ZQK1_9BURK|nr:response regulator [Caenimonas sedimenti]TWO70626.1 response regulator [Caenimonas sedimenti]
MNSNEQYLVDVIGFNDVERSMLSSIFALAARRDPGFAQYEPGTPGRTPDIYLVDAENQEAFGEFRALHKRTQLPAVLIGTSALGTSFPVLPRPLQWARLLQALEDTLPGGDEMPVSAEPIAPEPAPALRRTLSGSGHGRTQPIQPISDAATNKRMLGDTVLVVDDNATVRAFMQAKLAPYGFEVDFAETGEEAVGLSGTQEYTCVFLDVVLPGIDGYQVCKLIKSNKQAIKKTAVVMLTSRSSPFDKLRGSLAGCDEYLTKPLDEDRLLEVIAKFLPGSRKHGERAHR